MALTVANPQGMQVVWFKRDLRVHDHAALTAAAQAGKVLCIYVCEPQLWQQPDASGRQWHFLLESLSDLQRSLARRGSRLHVLVGEVTDVLEQLHQQLPIAALYAHEETGNDFTYRRDIAVGQWCRQHRVAWQEFRQFGVVRRLRNRDDWKDHWESHNAAATKPVPAADWAQLGCLPGEVALKDLPLAMQRLLPGLLDDNPVGRQRGGRQSGIAILEDFLQRRSRQYRGGISSPLSATSACSRLSAHLAYGCLSLREIVQATQRHLASTTDLNAHHQRGLRAFISRLYWHCHFIQKLESQPDIEWRNLHQGYDGLREADWNDAHFAALIHARTGWPLVDACATGCPTCGRCRMPGCLSPGACQMIYNVNMDWCPAGISPCRSSILKTLRGWQRRVSIHCVGSPMCVRRKPLSLKNMVPANARRSSVARVPVKRPRPACNWISRYKAPHWSGLIIKLQRRIAVFTAFFQFKAHRAIKRTTRARIGR